MKKIKKRKIDEIIALVKARDLIVNAIDGLVTVCGKEPMSIHIFKHKDFLELLKEAQATPTINETGQVYKFVYEGVTFRNIYDEME